MLKVSPRKGVIRFGKRGKLNPRYIRPFKILEHIGPVAYKLEFPEEFSNVHSSFHVSNLKKCLSDESLVIPMKELRLDDKLNFVEQLPITLTFNPTSQTLPQKRTTPPWQSHGSLLDRINQGLRLGLKKHNKEDQRLRFMAWGTLLNPFTEETHPQDLESSLFGYI
ncbi:hypothetical protein Tco_0845529 [Tanacetum coccineum]